MILMPMWVVEDTEQGIEALLGSEPRSDAEREWIPREFVVSCVYARVPYGGLDAAPGEGSPRFALVTLKEVPEAIRNKNPDFYRKVN